MKLTGIEPVERAFLARRARQCGSLETALAEWVCLCLHVEHASRFPRRHPQARVALRQFARTRAVRRAHVEEARLAGARALRHAPPAEWSLGALMAAFLLPAEAWNARRPPGADGWTPEPVYTRFIEYLTAMRCGGEEGACAAATARPGARTSGS